MLHTSNSTILTLLQIGSLKQQKVCTTSKLQLGWCKRRYENNLGFQVKHTALVTPKQFSLRKLVHKTTIPCKQKTTAHRRALRLGRCVTHGAVGQKRGASSCLLMVQPRLEHASGSGDICMVPSLILAASWSALLHPASPNIDLSSPACTSKSTTWVKLSVMLLRSA